MRTKTVVQVVLLLAVSAFLILVTFAVVIKENGVENTFPAQVKLDVPRYQQEQPHSLRRDTVLRHNTEDRIKMEQSL